MSEDRCVKYNITQNRHFSFADIAIRIFRLHNGNLKNQIFERNKIIFVTYLRFISNIFGFLK